jgi:hypothetical protein
MFKWLLTALYHAIVIFFVTTAVMDTSYDDGRVGGIYETGITAFMSLILVVNLQLAIFTQYVFPLQRSRFV